MNKLFNKIAALSVGLAMAIGVGVAIGSKSDVRSVKAAASTFAEAPDVSMDDDLGNATTSSALPTTGTSGWVTSIASNSYDTQYGRGYAFGSGADPVITYYSSDTTWSKVIVISSANSSNSSLSVSVGGVSYSPASRSVANGTANKNQEYVFEGNSSGNVEVSVTNTNASKSTWILDVGLYEASGSTSVSGVSLDITSAYGHVGGSNISLTATVSPASADDKSVSWSTSNGSVATVSNGSVSLVGPGSATITVTTTDGSFTDSCEITVFSATHGLQESDPLTIAEAIKVAKTLVAGSNTSDEYYISGEVTSITTAYSTQYGNITLAFTANAETFSAYRALVSQSYGEAIAIGDTILWKGYITNYQGNTYQTAAGGEIITGTSYPEPTMKETTLAGFIGATEDDEKAELYHFSAKVKSVDNTTYGNLTLTDDTSDLTVYGSTATASALAWGTSTGIYTFTNPKDYSSNNTTKDIAAGDTVEVKMIRYTHNGDIQAQGLIISVTPAPVVTYTVTYASGGADSGTVPTDSNSPYNSGATVTVLGNTGNLAKDGYTFAGWSDGANTYQAGATFTISSNTTLTAQWAAPEQPSNPPYSADFTSVETHSYTQNKEFELGEKGWVASVSQVNAGVFYLGCNSSNASKGVLNDNSTFASVVTALAANDSVYSESVSTAHAYALLFDHPYNGVKNVTFEWVGGNNAFQVYLFGDSGSGYTLLASENYATSGQAVSGSVSWTDPSTTTNFLRFAIVARPGTTSSTATSKTLRAGTFSIAAQVAPTYTISYDSNGGTGTMSDTTGTAPEVQACSFTAPEGKEFDRWNTSSDGTGVDYAVGTTVSANITLFAIWTAAPVDPSDYFTQITSTSDITDGKYVIVYDNLIFDGSLNSFDVAGNTKDLTLENLLTSYFTISSGNIQGASGKYIGRSANTNGLDTSDTALANTVSIDGEGNLVVVSDAGAYLRYNSTSGQERFRYFKSTTYTAQQAIQLYKVNLGKVILSTITCNASGTTQPTGSWSALEDYYDTLSTDEKADLVDVVANEGGTEIQQAMAKYDYIVGKYGTAAYKDFIGRNPAPIGSGRIAIFGTESLDSTNLGAIAIVVTLISATALGGYFLLKKKKTK